MRHFLLYAVIRLGLWVLIWWVLTLVDVGVMLAGVLAALIAMLISILFLDRLRDAAAMRWKAADERRAERRGSDVDEDAEFEDGMLDGMEGDGQTEAGQATNNQAGDEQDGPDQGGRANDSAGADAAQDAEDAPAGPAQLPGLDEPDPEASDLDEPGQVRGSDR